MEKKITYGSQNWITANIKGEKKRFRYPVAFNHLALMAYSPNWDIEMILVFEKLLVMYNLNKCEPVFYQGFRLEEDLHIKRGKVAKARKKLKTVGILHEGRGRKNMKMYSLDRDKVIELLPFIYKLPEEEPEKTTMLLELKEFFNFFLTKGGGAGRFKLTGKDRNESTDGESYDVDYSIT